MSFITKRFLSKYAKNSQIYVHNLNPGKNLYSLSSNPDSLAIGYGKDTPNEFVVEKKFIEKLHETIGSKVHKDFSFIMEAGMAANSYMPIYDFREIPNYARIPEVDAIFGYVMVDSEGKIVPNSYEANTSYRLVDGVNGLVKLSDYLCEEVRKVCEA